MIYNKIFTLHFPLMFACILQGLVRPYQKLVFNSHSPGPEKNLIIEYPKIMICSQKQHSSELCLQSYHPDLATLSLTSLQALKERALISRAQFLAPLMNQLEQFLSDLDAVQLQQIPTDFRARAEPIISKYSATLGEIGCQLRQLFTSLISDITAQNLIGAIINKFVQNYSSEFNQVSTHLSMDKQVTLYHPSPKRVSSYQQVNHYVLNRNDRAAEIEQKLISTKSVHKCPHDCSCFEGVFACQNMKNSVECDHPAPCLNQPIRRALFKQLGIDLVLMDTFGLDSLGAKMLYLLVPSYETQIKEIIINLNLTRGNLKQTLTNVYDIQFQCSQIHPLPKGKGLICCSEAGFQAEAFVGCYFGELYTPARWYDKRVVLNKRLQDGNVKQPKLSPFAVFELEGDLLVTFFSKRSSWTQQDTAISFNI